jgi:hypothetical protein
MPLAPIAEVRHVTFAARYVLEQDDFYQPMDVVRVRFIPHFSEYASDEIQNTWYTTQDMKDMKQQAFQEVDLLLLQNYNNYKNKKNNDEQRFASDIRGLERLVYSDKQTCVKLRNEAQRALLEEQYRQRAWMYSINNPGGIVHPGDEYLNDELIRQVVMTNGGSMLSQNIAYQMAKQDELEANEYLERSVPEDRDEKDTVGQCATARQPQPQLNQETWENKSQESELSSFEQCCLNAKVVEVVGRSLFLHSLLRNFFELRRGDALLD